MFTDQTKEEKPAIGGRGVVGGAKLLGGRGVAGGAKLLGGRYRVEWADLCCDGVGVRLPLGLKRL